MEYERAAAMALVNLQFDWALSFLSRASECKYSFTIDMLAICPQTNKESISSGLVLEEKC